MTSEEATAEPSSEPFNFTSMMTANVGHFMIGFVAIRGDRFVSRGSGTLISFGNIAGVLTCAHVLQEVLKEDEIGILCFFARQGDVQMLKVRLDPSEQVMFSSSPWSELGQDLAFLRLPKFALGEIEKLASVLDGERQRSNALAGEPDPSSRVELVCGVIDERTKAAVVEGPVAVTQLEGLMNVGRVVEKSDAGGFDLYRFQPVPDDPAKLPKTYKGDQRRRAVAALYKERGRWDLFIGAS